MYSIALCSFELLASSDPPGLKRSSQDYRWQTLIGGLLLHVSWKLGWVEINSSSRSHVLAWLPASVLFVGIIYAGSRALSRLAIPVFLTLHNVAEVIICGYQKCFQKEKTSPAKICSALFLLAAAGCLPLNDSQFDPDGYFWAIIHLLCVGSYKILQKSQKPSALSDIDQQYLNYIFSVVLLAFASHPTGDLFSVLDFPFLYFYRFHGSCCASGFLGFFLMFSTVKLKNLLAPGQCAAWIFFAKIITAGLSILLFDAILTSATTGCCCLNFSILQDCQESDSSANESCRPSVRFHRPFSGLVCEAPDL
nr:transmembrane protein 241 isoform X2 [Pan troglodytes]